MFELAIALTRQVETDRRNLQELFRVAEEVEHRIRVLAETLPVGREEQTCLQLFVSSDPFDDRQWRHNLSFDEFAGAMNKTVSASTPTPQEHHESDELPPANGPHADADGLGALAF